MAPETEELVIMDPPDLPEDMPAGEEEEVPEEEVAAAPPVEDEDPEVLEALNDLGLDPSKKGRVSKRIKQEISKRKTAVEEAANWRQEALRLAQTPKPVEAPVTPIQTGLPKPKWEDFDSTEQFTEALTEWKVETKLAERESKDRQAKTDKQKQEWNRKGLEKYPDFMEKVVNNQGIKVTTEMAQAIIANEAGHDIAYHLAINPTESFRIAGLLPVEQAVEIRKLASKMKTKPPKTETEAPAPTKPVGSRETPAKSADIEKRIKDGTVSYRDYEAYMNKRDAGGQA